MYSKKEYDSGIYTRKEADRWLSEGDLINVGSIQLHVMETPGHSPGSLSYYSDDVSQYKDQPIDGIIFTGDLLFRRSIGRSDLKGGNQQALFSSIREKIMENPDITDNFLVCPGHMGISTVGEERNNNMYRKYFT
jgi:glyoxylase-like metal-dependent hydrolase (beta-lactamase superfamily II)